eukprot:3899563-Rhodomonas_salina.1
MSSSRSSSPASSPASPSPASSPSSEGKSKAGAALSTIASTTSSVTSSIQPGPPDSAWSSRSLALAGAGRRCLSRTMCWPSLYTSAALWYSQNPLSPRRACTAFLARASRWYSLGPREPKCSAPPSSSRICTALARAAAWRASAAGLAKKRSTPSWTAESTPDMR